MFSAYAFRPKPIVTAATLLFVAATLGLSSWQFGRAEQKLALEERYLSSLEREPVDLGTVDFSSGPEQLRYLRVSARGDYAQGEGLLVDNRMSNRRPGFWALAPFFPEQSGKAILVARGWIPASADRSIRPVAPPPLEAGKIAGFLLPDSSDVLELSDETVSGNVWQNAKIEPMGRALGLELHPMLLVLDSPVPGLEPIEVKPDFKVLNSVSYAWQWLSFALLAAVLYVCLNLRRKR